MCQCILKATKFVFQYLVCHFCNKLMLIRPIRFWEKHLCCCGAVNKYPLASSPFRNAKCFSSCSQRLTSLAVLGSVQISISTVKHVRGLFIFVAVLGDNGHMGTAPLSNEFLSTLTEGSLFRSLLLLNLKLELSDSCYVSFNVR